MRSYCRRWNKRATMPELLFGTCFVTSCLILGEFIDMLLLVVQNEREACVNQKEQ